MKAPRIAHITLQPTQNDARVARAVACLEAAGYACPLVGPSRDAAPGFGLPAMTRGHKMRIALTFGPAARTGYRAAHRAFFALPHHRAALRALIAARPDAIHAHDWDGLVVAEAAARQLRAPFAYDAHELAAEMHAERRGWRLVVAPLIRRLEGPAARRAAFTITVGPRLAASLRDRLALDDPVAVIRNIPPIHPVGPPAPRPHGARLLLHYHGILARGRGLETALDALEMLPADTALRLTGPWRQPAFQAAVEARVRARPRDGRLTIHPAVPPAELVAHAASADIGLCLLSGDTAHDRVALPNKLFEYLNAGLAVLVSGSDEMADIVRAHRCGLVLGRAGGAPTPRDLAVAVAALGRDDIVTMRRNALAAARAMTWSAEAARLVALWDAVLR